MIPNWEEFLNNCATCADFKIALDGIVDLGPEGLAYVSCDPATLGRDAKRLTAGGYQLIQATPFDLFPQTYHIESVSFWEKMQ